MKIIAVVFVTLCCICIGNAQNFENLSKKELRTILDGYQNRVDSLSAENKNLLKLIGYRDSVINENSQLIIELTNNKKTLVDSINIFLATQKKILKSHDSLILFITNYLSITDENDFLNNYFFNQSPLNGSFKLSLTKVILEVEYGWVRGGVSNLFPEILDMEDLLFFGVKANLQFPDVSSVNELLIQVSKDDFDKALPEIRISDNKLVTFSYSNKSKENFLLNIQRGELNNFRETIDFKLASEAVNINNSEDSKADMIWSIVSIKNQCYLALKYKQLKRVNIPIYSISEGFNTELVGGSTGESYLIKYDGNERNYRYKTTGNGFYVARNKDEFMNKAYFIEPSNLIYLFKLEEVSK